MKSLVRVLVILGLGTIITSYFFHEPPRRFYYAFEEKIYLEEVGDKVTCLSAILPVGLDGRNKEPVGQPFA